MTTQQKQNRFDKLEDIRVTTLNQIAKLQNLQSLETDEVKLSKIDTLIDYHWSVIDDAIEQKRNL